MNTARHSQTYRIATFLATIAVAVLLLKLLNWLPGAVQKDNLRKYHSVDEARTALKIKRIYTPTYFPEHIQWPPIEIFAQKRPFLMVAMHFLHATNRELALSIYQGEGRALFEPQPVWDVLYVRKESSVLVNGREGRLVLAVCQGNRRCNRLSWNADGLGFTIIADDSPEQILKLAESMI
ncbi:MAG: hypothetical protein OHK006_04180 [Thermodesulfovibrionales bacterium]